VAYQSSPVIISDCEGLFTYQFEIFDARNNILCVNYDVFTHESKSICGL